MPAYAAPGDPRFLQGTVEWPAALTAEPVVIVRGDDGHVYSADVAGARRQGAESVCVGTRVALLVLEGARKHEVTAIVIGTGDAVSLSRALSQGALPHAPAAPMLPPPPAVVAPAALAPAPPAAAVIPAAVLAPSPAIAATPPAITTPAPTVTTPAAAPTVVVTAPAAPIAAPVAAATPAVPVATPVAATTPAAPIATPAATMPPAPPVATPVATPTPAPATAMPSAPPTPPAATASPAPRSPGKANGPSGDRKQWARLDGRVQSVDGALLVLRADNGSLVMVDISQLNPNVTSALRRERLVSVYGYPIEQKFEAAGYIELDPSHPEPPRVRHR
jgi:hypothetical protein